MAILVPYEENRYIPRLRKIAYQKSVSMKFDYQRKSRRSWRTLMFLIAP